MTILKPNSKYYPKKLLEIKNHPSNLYVEGNPEILNNDSIAIVGSRDCSEYGERQTERFAKYFSENNITVVSGLALGIDTVAHISSFNKIGKTIAVIASGFDNIYPSSNKELVKKIIENGGCIISEYSPDTKVEMQRFPKRNRIISAISQAVLVIESKYRSGSNITAREAIKQNKEVFCIPGNIDSSRSIGTNRLIQQGANLVMSPIEVLEILEADEYIKNNINIEDNRNMQEAIADDNNLKPKSNIYEKGKNNIINFRDEMEKQILELIGKLPISIDEISMETKINVSDISEKLFMLELDGIVKKISGDRYVLEK